MKIALYSQKYKAEYAPLLTSIFEELIAYQDNIVIEADLLRRYSEHNPFSS